MNAPTASFQLNPDFVALIARERQQEMYRDAAERRLARAARKQSGRTRGRFLRWH